MDFFFKCFYSTKNTSQDFKEKSKITTGINYSSSYVTEVLKQVKSHTIFTIQILKFILSFLLKNPGIPLRDYRHTVSLRFT